MSQQVWSHEQHDQEQAVVRDTNRTDMLVTRLLDGYNRDLQGS